MKICVLIPAYNEEDEIASVVAAARKHIPDVVVISDGSTDRTAQLAKENGALAIEYAKNRGKGGALKVGFEHAIKNKFDAVITMDADGQHLPEEMAEMIRAAEELRVGIVVGNRMAKPEGMPKHRFVTNLFMSFMISLICGQNVPDTQCGYRLIKCGLLEKMKLTSENYEIESEILIRTRKTGYKITSCPIKSIYAGQDSMINPFLDTWRFLAMLVKVML